MTGKRENDAGKEGGGKPVSHSALPNRGRGSIGARSPKNGSHSRGPSVAPVLVLERDTMKACAAFSEVFV